MFHRYATGVYTEKTGPVSFARRLRTNDRRTRSGKNVSIAKKKNTIEQENETV